MSTKKVYLYNKNNEYTGVYEAQESPLEPGVFIVPVQHLPIAPPVTNEHEVAVCENGKWVVYPDVRGVPMYKKTDGTESRMESYGPVPDTHVVETPPKDMYNPSWNGTNWVETAIVYHGRKVTSKIEVDEITRLRIINLGEEKVKTEKIIAGSGECPAWDIFITTRSSILREGDEFISANSLT